MVKMDAHTRLKVDGLYKSFLNPNDKDPIEVLEDICLEVKEGSFVSIVGPSGCGKTTLLRIISGLESPTKGTITLWPPGTGDKGVGLVFQEYALFPWRTAIENIEFGLEIRGLGPDERREKAMELFKRFGLLGFEHHYPAQLSGGMQQRVAIARTLIVEPRLILMDEPFGSLDSQTRSDMQDFLLGLWEERVDTILFVTHNVQEAIFLGTELIVFSRRPARILRAWDLRQLRKGLPFSRDVKGLEREVMELLRRERVSNAGSF